MKSCCKDALEATKPVGSKPALSLKMILSFPFIVIIKLYQWIISPLLGPKCRFTPTCSQYSLEAFRKFGPIKGLWLACRRIVSCHPWGRHGYDPVP